MNRRVRIGVLILLVMLGLCFAVQAESNPFDGAAWDTGVITGEATPAPTPEATPVPDSDTSDPLPTPSTQEYDTPSQATYRYLKCWPASDHIRRVGRMGRYRLLVHQRSQQRRYSGLSLCL